MSHQHRNPSAPHGELDYCRNMEIAFLKPNFSLIPMNISVDLFLKNLFIPPESEHESESFPNKVPTTKEKTPENERDYINPKNLKFVSEKEIYEPSKACFEHNEDAVSVSLEPERTPKEKNKNTVTKHSIKKETTSDEKHKSHRRSSEHRKKKIISSHSLDSDSDEMKSSKPKKRHKRCRNERNVSKSKDSDYYETDSKKKSVQKHGDFRECDYSDCDSGSNSKSARYQRRSKNYKREYNTTDSDRSDGDHHYRYYQNDHDSYSSRTQYLHDPYYGNEYNAPDSDRSNSRITTRSDRFKRCHQRMRTESTDNEFDLSESKYATKPEGKKNEEEFKFMDYYCKVCQLQLNSECTFQSHISGKKHKRAEKSQLVPEMMKKSLNNLAAGKEPYFPGTKKHKQVNRISQLEGSLDEFADGKPVPGLNHVQEIRNGKETTYYCHLCDAPCMPSSIMPHLLGFKHQLNSLKEIDYECYNANRDSTKREFGDYLNFILLKDEETHGRGKITVWETIQDPDACGLPNDAGPSTRHIGIVMPDKEVSMIATKAFEFPEEIDASKNDYYCKICDSHMNNITVFSAHMVGKRHLKNERKSVGERSFMFKGKGVRATSYIPSELESIVSKNQEDVIVGLNFIRENKTENGSLYICYICGSSCTTDIVNHLISTKHRIKYLETVNEKGIMPNAIQTISELDVNMVTRESLIVEECEKIEKKYGRGKVEVYLSNTGYSRW